LEYWFALLLYLSFQVWLVGWFIRKTSKAIETRNYVLLTS